MDPPLVPHSSYRQSPASGEAAGPSVLRELEMVGRVDSPGIVRVADPSRADHGAVPVLERVPRLDLGACLEGPLGRETFHTVALQVVRAVGGIHDAHPPTGRSPVCPLGDESAAVAAGPAGAQEL